MGNSLCTRRAQATVTEAELRERRLRRFAEEPQSGSQEKSEQTGNEAPEPAASVPEPVSAPAAASPKHALKTTSTATAHEGQPLKIAKSTSADSTATRAAQVMKPLVRDANYQTIELVLRIVTDILRQPTLKRIRSISFASIRERLRPEVCEQEMSHLCNALSGIGFVVHDAGCDNARLELADSDDLALARELVQKIEKTRSLWKPAHIEQRAREDAKQVEVMSATGCCKEHALEALAATGSDTVFAIRLIADGPKDEDGKPLRSDSYILNITSREEEFVRQVWNSPHEPLAEYREAAHVVCLSRRWAAHTKLGRILASVDAEFKEDPARLTQMQDKNHFEEVLFKLIMKAYKLSSIELVRAQMTTSCGFEEKPCNVFDTMCHFCFFGPHRILGGGNPPPLKYITWSLQTLLMLEEPEIIEMKIYEICDVAHRCGSARKQVFNSLVTHCCGLRDANKVKASGADISESNGKSPREVALARFEECIEDFLDDHKTQAFTSAFIAPARYYLHYIDHKEGALNMTVHGLNWYLTLVHATLGMPLPLSGHYDDHVIPHPSLVDYWRGLTEEAWSFFSDPTHFGKYSDATPRLSDDVNFIREKLDVGKLPEGHDPGPKAMCLGNSAANPGHDHEPVRKRLAVYVERFAHFFRAEFLVRKAFETLNAETKPEHTGFRNAAQTLYTYYRMEVLEGSGADTLLEHCYQDEYFMEPDVTRMARFFAWLGITKDGEEIGT